MTAETQENRVGRKENGNDQIPNEKKELTSFWLNLFIFLSVLGLGVKDRLFIV
jgi:hypothetical protein